MILKVPKQVQVGGHKYSIVLSDDIKDSDCNAAINHRLLTIVVGVDRPASGKVEGLLHEVIHAVGTIYECELEERQVSAVSQGLYQVFSQLGMKLDWSNIPNKSWRVPL